MQINNNKVTWKDKLVLNQIKTNPKAIFHLQNLQKHKTSLSLSLKTDKSNVGILKDIYNTSIYSQNLMLRVKNPLLLHARKNLIKGMFDRSNNSRSIELLGLRSLEILSIDRNFNRSNGLQSLELCISAFNCLHQNSALPFIIIF